LLWAVDMGLHLDPKERAFVEQREVFLAKALQMLGMHILKDLPEPNRTASHAVTTGDHQ
jgi:hypothetical protein